MSQPASRSGLFLLILLAFAGLAVAPQARAQQTPAEKTAEQVFKNIQVFKGKPANELRPTMSFIAGSLGVRCSFCHEEDKSSDAKPTKKRARQMIEMVYAINKSTFGGRNEVNCYTCHQGSPHPNGRLSLAGAEKSAAPKRPAAGAAKLPTAAALIAKYEAAIGGAGALAAIHSETVTARQSRFGRSSAETLTRADGKILVSNGAKSQSGYDGSQFWSVSPRGADLNPSSETITQLRAQLPLYPGAGLKAEGARVLGTETVHGMPAYLVVTRGPRGAAQYDFDTRTGLLVRYTTGTPTFLGALPLAVGYSDYRTVGAVKLPFAVSLTTHEFTTARTISAIHLNPAVDAAQFQAPAAKPAAGGTR